MKPIEEILKALIRRKRMKKPKEKFPGLKTKALKGASLGPFEGLSRSNKTIWDSKKPKDKKDTYKKLEVATKALRRISRFFINNHGFCGGRAVEIAQETLEKIK